MSELSCDEARAARLDRASGPLEEGREASLERHLQGCRKCEDHAREIDALEATLGETFESIEASVAARFQAIGRRERGTRARVFLLAAGVALGLGLAWALASFALSPIKKQNGQDIGTPCQRGQVLASEGTWDLEGARVALAEKSRLVVQELAPRKARLEAGAVSFRVPGGAGSLDVETKLGDVIALGAPGPIELSIEISQTQEGDSMKPRALATGASVLVVGVVSGTVLVKMIGGEPVPVQAGEVALAAQGKGVQVSSLAQLEKEAQQGRELPSVKTELLASKARVLELEKRLARAEGSASVSSANAADKKAPSSTKPDATADADASASSSSSPDAVTKKVHAIVQGLDWAQGTKALVDLTKAQAKEGGMQQLDPQVYIALSKMNVTVAEIAKLRGLSNPWQAYADPEVQLQFAPAWLNALGANLDADQTKTLQQQIAENSKPLDPNAPPVTLLERLAHEAQDNADFEKNLVQLLRPDQYAGYLATVGNDPFYGHNVSQSRFGSFDQAGLVQAIAGEWTKSFELSPSAQPGAQAAATQFVQASLAVPPLDPNLDPQSKRLATLDRTARILALQLEAENALARDPSLSADEQARAKAGSSQLLTVRLGTR